MQKFTSHLISKHLQHEKSAPDVLQRVTGKIKFRLNVSKCAFCKHLHIFWNFHEIDIFDASNSFGQKTSQNLRILSRSLSDRPATNPLCHAQTLGKMGSSPQFETKNFIFIIVECSDETRFCVSHEGIPIGLGRLFFTGIALAIKIPSQNEEAPHYEKLLLTKYTDSTLTLREACLPIYTHHTMVPFISISYLPHHS